LNEPVRAFAAVFPPLEVREEALAAARRQPLGDRVRWVRSENVHLTLKFLGDVREEVLESVRAALGEVCAAYAPFNVKLAGLGAFPSARRARILWASVGEGSEQLRSLATDLDAASAPLGFERERHPYTPHLTLGRVRGRPANLTLPAIVGSFGFKVGDVELVESVLTPEGAVYGTLDTFALGESNRRVQP
jgi:RNA 2',3'-cyclic 3'-phosphodiesterase